MLKQGAASPPRWVCSRTCIPQQEGLVWVHFHLDGRKWLLYSEENKQTENIWEDLKLRTTLRQKDLLKAHSRAPGCVGRHVHNFLQYNLNSLRNDFDKLEHFQGIRVRNNFIASPGSTFRGPQTHTHTHTLRDLMEWFNNYQKVSGEVGEQQTLLN